MAADCFDYSAIFEKMRHGIQQEKNRFVSMAEITHIGFCFVERLVLLVAVEILGLAAFCGVSSGLAEIVGDSRNKDIFRRERKFTGLL